MSKSDKTPTKVNTKLRKGDMVQIIAGTEKDKKGKILDIDRKKNRIIVEGVNIISKHVKQGSKESQQGGIIKREAYVHASNVMYVHKGKTTRLGYKLVTEEKNGVKKTIKYRIAKSTGEMID